MSDSRVSDPAPHAAARTAAPDAAPYDPGAAASTGSAVVARGPVTPADPVVVVAGWEVSARRSTAALTVVDLAPWAKVQLKATPDGAVETLLGVRFGHSGTDLPDGPPVELVVGSGPGEWLLLAAPGTANGLLDWCRDRTATLTGLVTAVDLSHGRALFRLTGTHAADTLALLCPIDFSDEVTPDRSAFRSTVAEVVTDVVRHDVERGRSYLLHCERSSGQYLFDALLEAGQGYGIDVDGFPYREGRK